MLTFTEFYKQNQRRKIVFESIYNKVLEESKKFKKEFEELFYSGNKIIFEDVQDLVDVELHQQKQDIESMNKFINEYKQLMPEDKIELVKQLSIPLPGSKYIENNNEIKLILIYKNDKDSKAGELAYEKIILNKQKWFEVVAGKAAASGKIPASQASDYAQQMTLTLLGGGEYNQKNDKKFSLDAYDPFTGVPFNSFVNTYIINSAKNKFNPLYNKSVSTDYAGQKMNVVSADALVNPDSDDKEMNLIDNIASSSLNPEEQLSDTEQKKLLKLYLKNPALNPKERKAIELRYGLNNNGEESTLLNIGLQLGYPSTSAKQNARRILASAENKLKQFAKQNFKQ